MVEFYLFWWIPIGYSFHIKGQMTLGYRLDLYFPQSFFLLAYSTPKKPLYLTCLLLLLSSSFLYFPFFYYFFSP